MSSEPEEELEEEEEEEVEPVANGGSLEGESPSSPDAKDKKFNCPYCNQAFARK